VARQFFVAMDASIKRVAAFEFNSHHIALRMIVRTLSLLTNAGTVDYHPIRIRSARQRSNKCLILQLGNVISKDRVRVDDEILSGDLPRASEIVEERSCEHISFFNIAWQQKFSPGRPTSDR
jgi:hypothetical protein